MALFRIKATPSAGLTGYSFKMHGTYDIPMKDNEGCLDLSWITCGSGSNFVDYKLEGPVGASLSFTISCDGRQVHQNERTKHSAEPESYSDTFQN